jgi:hypothetical protein
MATVSTRGDPFLPWLEIGRAAPGNEAWAAWVVRHGPDLTLYRCLTAVGDTAFVTIDIHGPGKTQTQRLHSGQCQLPREGHALEGSISGLLERADEAIRHAMERQEAAAGSASRAA